MIIERYPEIARLSTAERTALISELWTSIEEDSSTEPVDPLLADELKGLLEEYRAHPDRVTTWEAIKARAIASRS